MDPDDFDDDASFVASDTEPLDQASEVSDYSFEHDSDDHMSVHNDGPAGEPGDSVPEGQNRVALASASQEYFSVLQEKDRWQRKLEEARVETQRSADYGELLLSKLAKGVDPAQPQSQYDRLLQQHQLCLENHDVLITNFKQCVQALRDIDQQATARLMAQRDFRAIHAATDICMNPHFRAVLEEDARSRLAESYRVEGTPDWLLSGLRRCHHNHEEIVKHIMDTYGYREETDFKTDGLINLDATSQNRAPNKEALETDSKVLEEISKKITLALHTLKTDLLLNYLVMTVLRGRQTVIDRNDGPEITVLMKYRDDMLKSIVRINQERIAADTSLYNILPRPVKNWSYHQVEYRWHNHTFPRAWKLDLDWFHYDGRATRDNNDDLRDCRNLLVSELEGFAPVYRYLEASAKQIQGAPGAPPALGSSKGTVVRVTPSPNKKNARSEDASWRLTEPTDPEFRTSEELRFEHLRKFITSPDIAYRIFKATSLYGGPGLISSKYRLPLDFMKLINSRVKLPYPTKELWEFLRWCSDNSELFKIILWQASPGGSYNRLNSDWENLHKKHLHGGIYWVNSGWENLLENGTYGLERSKEPPPSRPARYLDVMEIMRRPEIRAALKLRTVDHRTKSFGDLWEGMFDMGLESILTRDKWGMIAFKKMINYCHDTFRYFRWAPKQDRSLPYDKLEVIRINNGWPQEQWTKYELYRVPTLQSPQLYERWRTAMIEVGVCYMGLDYASHGPWKGHPASVKGPLYRTSDLLAMFNQYWSCNRPMLSHVFEKFLRHCHFNHNLFMVKHDRWDAEAQWQRVDNGWPIHTKENPAAFFGDWDYRARWCKAAEKRHFPAI